MNARALTRFDSLGFALSDVEVERWRLFTGPRTPLPATLDDLVARIQGVVQELDAGGSPDERLAAMLAREFARDALSARHASCPAR